MIEGLLLPFRRFCSILFGTATTKKSAMDWVSTVCIYPSMIIGQWDVRVGRQLVQNVQLVATVRRALGMGMSSKYGPTEQAFMAVFVHRDGMLINQARQNAGLRSSG
jgi:hypothetical protein